MKLVDLEQQIFVPVVDETHGGVTVEMKMTVGEFFGKCCEGFEPEVVEAIPVAWLRQFQDKMPNTAVVMGVDVVLKMWEKEAR
jgi:hypothetical protein